MFRDYNNFDVDNYIRDADVVDLSRIFSESSDIHQQTANCLNSSQPNCRLNYPVKIRTILGTPPKEAAKKSQQTCFFCDETDDNLRRAATLTLDSKARADATRLQDQKRLVFTHCFGSAVSAGSDLFAAWLMGGSQKICFTASVPPAAVRRDAPI